MAQFNVAQWLVDRHVDEGKGTRVAIRCEGVDTTYAQLQAELWRAQALLSKLGAAAGDRVAMVVQDDLAFPAWFLGAQRSGVIPTPLSTMLKGTSLGEIVADSQAEILVISDTFANAVPDILAIAHKIATVVVAGDAEIARSAVGDDHSVAIIAWADAPASDEQPVADTDENSPGFWLYSSGTTGVPKGVMHLHGNVRATVDTYATSILRIDQNDRFLSIAKLFFAYGLGNSLTFPLSVGATAILDPRPPTPATTVALLAEAEATLFFASPGFVAAVLDSAPDPQSFGSLRATVTAGESLPGPLQTRFADLTGRPVLDGIGSTELLHIFISNTIESQTAGASGHVVPGYSAELRNDEGDVITEPDMPGYLYVQGPSAAVGYWQRPDETAQAFGDGWVRTGDVYVRSTDDVWTFLGRNSDMIKAGGIWVSPAEVESVLIEHPSVLEAAVVGARNEDGLESTVAFVLAASGANPDPEELLAHCREHMAAFKRPSRIIAVDELPKTATGKIRRFELREQLLRAR